MLYYQIKAGERMFFEHYPTIAEAEKIARPLADSKKFGKVEIVLVETKYTPLFEVQPSSK